MINNKIRALINIKEYEDRRNLVFKLRNRGYDDTYFFNSLEEFPVMMIDEGGLFYQWNEMWEVEDWDCGELIIIQDYCDDEQEQIKLFSELSNFDDKKYIGQWFKTKKGGHIYKLYGGEEIHPKDMIRVNPLEFCQWVRDNDIKL